MDLSEKYIKMCWKAKELQKRWTPQVGDYYWLGPKHICHPEACRLLVTDPLRFRYFEMGERIWLPRQDQIQEFFDPKIKSSVDVGAYCLTLFNFLKKFKDVFWAESAEQAWLALWMWDEHNKIWHDKEEAWIPLEEIALERMRKNGNIKSSQ